jgi:phosphoglycerate kinase
MIVDELSLDSNGKTVLVRCDFNLPLKNSKIVDASRIEASLETSRFIASHGARAVLCSHLGRVPGTISRAGPRTRRPLSKRRLSRRVSLAPESVGDVTLASSTHVQQGTTALPESIWSSRNHHYVFFR